MHSALNSSIQAEEWLYELLDSQLGSIIIYEPISKNDGDLSVYDFNIIYSNTEAANIASLYRELFINEAPGDAAISTVNDPTSMYHQLVNIWETGAKMQNTFHHAGTDDYYRIVSRKLKKGVLVIANNVSSEVKDRKEIESLAQRLQTVIGTSQSGVHTFTPVYNGSDEIIDFRFVLVNQTIASYVGQTADALTGALASTYFPAYKTNGIFEVYKDCYLNGTRHHFDFHYEDGYDVFFNLLVVKLGDEVLVTLTDHTELKRVQRELETSISELKRSNASLEQFAHASSHDLQEPLRKIIVYTEKLLENDTTEMDDTCYSYLERIRSSSKRMHRLIKDLLVFAEVGAMKNTREEVNLSALIDEVRSDLELAITERNAIVYAEKLGTVIGDSLHLQLLFQNLLTNALKYSRHNVPPEIYITSEVVEGHKTGLPLGEQELQQQYCLVKVKDNGQGFSCEDSLQIFKIFQRLPQHRNEQNGTGIGLAIVQRIIENHKGYITAEGIPGNGATFNVFLPVN